MTTAIDRLEQMLNDKDAEIEDLRHKLYDAENKLEHDWPRHKGYKAEDAPNQDLPVPRLEIRWTESDDGDGYETTATYSLVYRHLIGEIVHVPMGVTRSSGAMARHIRGALIETPFRDGCHLRNEMIQLGLRGFVIAGDLVYEAKVCPRCGRLEDAHRTHPFGDRCDLDKLP